MCLNSRFQHKHKSKTDNVSGMMRALASAICTLLLGLQHESRVHVSRTTMYNSHLVMVCLILLVQCMNENEVEYE